MKAYRMIKTLLASLTLAILLGGTVEAVIIVDPDAFPAGTVLNNAYPNVTLTALGDVPNADVLSVEDTYTSTGTRVFGHNGDFPSDWGDGWDNWLRVDFAIGATEVSLDFIADDYPDENAVLSAYDPSGILVDQMSSTGTYGAGDVVTLTVTAPYVSYILAEPDVGGRDNWRLDHLVYEPIPEPATVSLLGLGGLALIRRRRR